MRDYDICGVPLSEIHKVQLEILEEVDRICKKNRIQYFLSGGTLLGAARHKGFIPWDDDIDLWMTRTNYKKFKKAIRTQLSEEFFPEDYYTKKEYPLSILKIEKRGTRFVEGVFSQVPLSHCIYIDIFPLDKVYRPIHKLQTAILIKLQAIRDYKVRGVGKNQGNKVKDFLYSAIPLPVCRALTEFFMRCLNFLPLKYYNQLSHRGRHWPFFRKEDIEDLIGVEFEGKEYPAPRKIDKILTDCYGDYMQLPPKDKQEPIHDIIECKV